jgi:spore germination protein GerM
VTDCAPAIRGRRAGWLPVLRLAVAAVSLMVAIFVGDAAAAERITFEVYFSKEGRAAADAACSHVVAVTRAVPATQGVARASLEQLFAGPTAAERAVGYHSWFSHRTRGILRNIRIIDGTSYVDLHDIRRLIPGASSSCGSSELIAQVEATLKQFATVERVVLAIDGQPRVFYEWLEMACDQSNDHCDEQHF